MGSGTAGLFYWERAKAASVVKSLLAQFTADKRFNFILKPEQAFLIDARCSVITVIDREGEEGCMRIDLDHGRVLYLQKASVVVLFSCEDLFWSCMNLRRVQGGCVLFGIQP